MKKYDPQKIERKWQKYWEAKKFYVVPDKANDKQNFYFLVEFPYPSGDLHIGHWYAFSVPDIAVRYWRMKGKNVMYPIGFDAFGLPAENAAIQRGLQPEDWTRKNIAHMTKQLKSMGAAFDWSRMVSTIDPDYYKWTQWIFLQFYKKGLAYRAKTFVNWCPKDKTVLANEQVIEKSNIKYQISKLQSKNQNGKNLEEKVIVKYCERCGTEVIQKEMTQWMYKITEYADRLVNDLERVDWPEVTKTAQRNWIGRSRGAIIKLLVPNSKFLIPVFTTRADTLYGTTYMVLAPEHPLVTKLTKDKQLDAVSKYLEGVKKKSELERTSLEKEKTGVFTGSYAVNPVNNERIPIWIADYVIGWYGTGAVMAVPAHDSRDFDFAMRYHLPIKNVVAPQTYADKNADLHRQGAYEDDGILINSREFTGFKSEDAREEIVEKLAKKGLAERKTNYKLHDWVLSRQRYWGTPIPMIHCGKCGYQPVSEKDLPVKLPKLTDYKPSADGRSPLSKVGPWIKVKCPRCGGEAERETDTMDTFVDSSWYFLRYTDPKNKKEFANSAKMKNWLPVDLYVGGAEHNTMHLLYSRFFTKALYDLKLIDFDPALEKDRKLKYGRRPVLFKSGVDEPFTVRINHGVIPGPDSQKMSKSRGNVVNPDDLVKKYGADAVRMYLAFMGPYDQGGPWNPGGIVGVYRFLNRVWSLYQKSKQGSETRNQKLETSLHRAIKKIGEDIENSHFNTAVSELMKLLNEIERLQVTIMGTFLKLLSPFAPHLVEEIWINVLGNKKSIHSEKWPVYDPKLTIEETVRLVVQINGKTRDIIEMPVDFDETAAREAALASEKIKKYLENTEINKTIFVKNRLINLVL